MAKTNDIQVILIRCGRTGWDDSNRLQGRTDLPLSESGREAAQVTVRDLAALASGTGIATIYAGPDEACVETGAMLSQATGARSKTVDDLAGLDLGIWDGLLESQLMERFPTAYRQWKERPASVNPPEGETFEEGDARVRRAMCRVLEKANGKPLAFVLRPIPFAMATLWLQGRPLNELWSVLEDGPQSQSLTVSRELIRTSLEELKAKA